MAYTPSADFEFVPAEYTPGTGFDFTPGGTNLGDLSATLAGVSGLFSGSLPAQASLSGELSGVSGAFSGSLPNIGGFSATLSGVSGGFTGYISPQAVLSGALSGVSGAFDVYVSPQATLSATLAGVSGEFVGKNTAHVGHLSATLDGVGGYLFAEYDSNVIRYVVNLTHSQQQDSHLQSHSAAVLQQTTNPTQTQHHSPRDSATPRLQPVTLDVGQTTKTHIQRCGTVDIATPLSQAITAQLDVLAWHTLQRSLWVDQAKALSQWVAIVAQQMTPIRPPDWRLLGQDMAEGLHHFIHTVYGEPANPYTPGTAFSLSGSSYTPGAAFGFLDAPPPVDLSLRTVRGIDGIRFVSPRQQGSPNKTKRCLPVQNTSRPGNGTSTPVDPERPPYQPPPGHTTLTIPTQTVYPMQHVISVKTVPGNVDVPVGQVSLSYDAESFAWQFSASLLDVNALDLVESSGEPVTLAISIDSLVWHVLVESIEHGIQFAKHSISLNGRSLTALLGSPYILPTSATQTSELTIQQLAETLMPVDWTINWNAPTWIVPSGAWSYTNQTPIQALASLVNDIGCVAVPHNTLKQITVQPRYPVYPWYYTAAPADLAIPEAALKAVSLRPSITTQANGVYVHGGETGGVLGWCRLAGSAGDRLAPTASNALMTDVIGCRLLGERILSGQWQQPVIKSATLPLDNDVFPLAKVGYLAAVTLGGDIIKGIINSVSIEANLNSVSQSIQIGEETANVWTLFNTLLPREPLLVGTVSSTDGTLSVITLLDGGVVSVRGTATVSSKVYIRAGRIEGPAPNMTQNEIVI